MSNNIICQDRVQIIRAGPNDTVYVGKRGVVSRTFIDPNLVSKVVVKFPGTKLWDLKTSTESVLKL